MDSDLIEGLIWLVVLVIAPLVQRLLKGKEQEPDWGEPPAYPDELPDEPYPEDVAPPGYPEHEGPMPYPGTAAPYPGDYEQPEWTPLPPAAPVVVDPWAEERAELEASLQTLEDDANAIARDARTARATRRFAEVVDDWVGPRIDELQGALRYAKGPPPAEVIHGQSDVELVLAQVESFIGQRRNPVLNAKLGDADAFAESCYRPIAEFAYAEGLGLTSNFPVCQLGPVDMGIYTGFIPTGIAPISLPSRFFERILWWPALAHEIAHDFYFATPGFDRGLREHLGLPGQARGSAPLRFDSQGLTVHELHRVFGGWLEELFCDVFGTLMVGPAYAYAAMELFADPSDPMNVARVWVSRDGRGYDEHPPRHLRMIAIAHILDEISESDDAAIVREEWARRHGGDPESILFPMGHQLLGLPVEPLADIVKDIAHRIHDDQLRVLSGYRLADVPGVDWGPHEKAEAERVARELLSGKVPHYTNARSVVAGAVFAWRQAPDREAQLMALARRDIRAVGTTEDSPDAYDLDLFLGRGKRGGVSPREAFILHTILAPSPAVRRMGLGPKFGSVIGRRVGR